MHAAVQHQQAPIQLLLHLLTVLQIVFPGTGIPVIPEVFLEPDLQIVCCHMVTCTLGQVQSIAAVNPTTQQNGDLERGLLGLATIAGAASVNNSFVTISVCAMLQHLPSKQVVVCECRDCWQWLSLRIEGGCLKLFNSETR